MTAVPFPSTPDIRALIAAELTNDIGAGDLSTLPFPDWQRTPAVGELICKEDGLLAGARVFDLVWKLLGGGVTSQRLMASGDFMPAGTVIARYTGPVATLVAGERTALNLLSHLSGIATITSKYVQRCQGTQARICDTRKTLPGLRTLEKYAVRVGGGVSHRFSLDGAMMLKDNHLAFISDLPGAVAHARTTLGPTVRIEVEVTNLEEFALAASAKVDAILLDNMDLDAIEWCGRQRPEGCALEVSGGVTLETVGKIAATGVDFISIGRLTHSASALDCSLELKSVSA